MKKNKKNQRGDQMKMYAIEKKNVSDALEVIEKLPEMYPEFGGVVSMFSHKDQVVVVFQLGEKPKEKPEEEKKTARKPRR